MLFMDSDDWAEATMLAEMSCVLAKRDQAQLVGAGFYIEIAVIRSRSTARMILSQKTRCITDAQSFRKASYKLFDKNLLYTPWNKLYESKYLERDIVLKFPKTFWDDFPFDLECRWM